jgi:flagellar biosynthetic protein FliQ
MGTDQVVAMGRLMLEEVMILTAPILLTAIAVSLVVNIVQVLVSLQDQTLSTVPRLLATGTALFILMPWMFRHLSTYALSIFSDFHKVLQ